MVAWPNRDHVVHSLCALSPFPLVAIMSFLNSENQFPRIAPLLCPTCRLSANSRRSPLGVQSLLAIGMTRNPTTHLARVEGSPTPDPSRCSGANCSANRLPTPAQDAAVVRGERKTPDGGAPSALWPRSRWPAGPTAPRLGSVRRARGQCARRSARTRRAHSRVPTGRGPWSASAGVAVVTFRMPCFTGSHVACRSTTPRPAPPRSPPTC